MKNILFSIKQLFTKCDCYIFHRTPLFKYRNNYDKHGVYICKDCGKIHIIKNNKIY